MEGVTLQNCLPSRVSGVGIDAEVFGLKFDISLHSQPKSSSVRHAYGLKDGKARLACVLEPKNESY